MSAQRLRALDHLDAVEDARAAPVHPAVRVQAARGDEERRVAGAEGGEQRGCRAAGRAGCARSSAGRARATQRSRKSPAAGSGGVAPGSASRASAMVTVVWASAPSAASASQSRGAKATRSMPPPAPPTRPRPSASVRALRRIASRITPVETVAREITSGRSERTPKAVTCSRVRSTPAKPLDVGGDVLGGDAEGQHRLVVAASARRRRSCASGVTPDQDVDGPAGVADGARELPGGADVARPGPPGPFDPPAGRRGLDPLAASAGRRRRRCGRRARRRARRTRRRRRSLLGRRRRKVRPHRIASARRYRIRRSARCPASVARCDRSALTKVKARGGSRDRKFAQPVSQRETHGMTSFRAFRHAAMLAGAALPLVLTAGDRLGAGEAGGTRGHPGGEVRVQRDLARRHRGGDPGPEAGRSGDQPGGVQPGGDDLLRALRRLPRRAAQGRDRQAADPRHHPRGGLRLPQGLHHLRLAGRHAELGHLGPALRGAGRHDGALPPDRAAGAAGVRHGARCARAGR